MDKRGRKRNSIVTVILLSVCYWIIALPIWAFTQVGDPAGETDVALNAAVTARHRFGLIVIAAELAMYLLLLALFRRHARQVD